MASLRFRNGIWYAQYYVNGQQRRVSLETDSKQVAKEKKRKLESSLARDGSTPFASRTPLADVVGAYVDQVRMRFRPKSAQTTAYYRRDCFGPICPALQITSRKIGPASKRLKPDPRRGGTCCARPIEAACFEQITTADISTFITQQMQKRKLKPKTANRFREILVRLFNWAMEDRGIRMPDGRNPAAAVQRYPEAARKSFS